MALLWLDGFETYKTSGALTDTLLLRRYGAISVGYGSYYTIATGRVTGYAVKSTTYHGYFRTPALTTNDTLICGFAYKSDDIVTSNTSALLILYDGSQVGINLRITSAGEIQIYKDSTLVATTTGLDLKLSRWYFIELKVKCNSSTGTYEVRVDGVNVLSATGVNTKAGANNYHDKVLFGSPTSNCYLDDVWICDSSGTYNNDFLGNNKIVAIKPEGDDSVNWSTVYPALSNHYADVDDGATSDDDTTYVEDATTGHRDLFTYTALPSALTQVLGLAVYNTCKVTDANSVVLKSVISSNGDEVVSGGDTISSTSYLVTNYISEIDPDTSAPYDIATIEAVKFGIEIG
jgi:hypothetical protein